MSLQMTSGWWTGQVLVEVCRLELSLMPDGGIDTTQLQRVAIWSGLECERGLGEDLGFEPFEGIVDRSKKFRSFRLSLEDVVLWRRIE
jgi:hypothetical protein